MVAFIKITAITQQKDVAEYIIHDVIAWSVLFETRNFQKFKEYISKNKDELILVSNVHEEARIEIGHKYRGMKHLFSQKDVENIKEVEKKLKKDVMTSEKVRVLRKENREKIEKENREKIEKEKIERIEKNKLGNLNPQNKKFILVTKDEKIEKGLKEFQTYKAEKYWEIWLSIENVSNFFDFAKIEKFEISQNAEIAKKRIEEGWGQIEGLEVEKGGKKITFYTKLEEKKVKFAIQYCRKAFLFSDFSKYKGGTIIFQENSAFSNYIETGRLFLKVPVEIVEKIEEVEREGKEKIEKLEREKLEKKIREGLNSGEYFYTYMEHGNYLTEKGLFVSKNEEKNDENIVGISNIHMIQETKNYELKTIEKLKGEKREVLNLWGCESKGFKISKNEKNEILKEIEEIEQNKKEKKEKKESKVEEENEKALKEAKETGKTVYIRKCGVYDGDALFPNREMGVVIGWDIACPDGKIEKKYIPSY